MGDSYEIRKVRVPEGTHLSQSSETTGAERALLRDEATNELVGPPELFPVDDDDFSTDRCDHCEPEDDVQLSPEQQMVVEALAAALTQTFLTSWTNMSCRPQERCSSRI